MSLIDEQEYTKNFEWKIWKKLKSFLHPYRSMFGLMVFLNFLCALVDIFIPLMHRQVISGFIEAGTTKGLVSFTLLYLLLIAVQAVTVAGFCRCSMNIEMNVCRDIRNKLFHHLQILSFSFYNTTPTGYLLTRVMSDSGKIAGMIAWNFADMLWALCYALGTFLAMFLLNWKLAIIVILVVPAISLLTWYFQNRILGWNRKVRKLNSRITESFNEGIMGASTTKTLVTEETMADSFCTLTGEMKAAGIHTARLNAVYIPLVSFLSTVTVALVLLQGGQLTLVKALDIATLSAFLTYAMSIFEPIQVLAGNLAEFISLQASIERVTDLLEKVPQVKDSPEVEAFFGDAFSPKKENWEPLHGEIEFKDVTFRYPDGGEDVLNHFSLHIPEGSTVAIVGETGAGKSTLVNLACRFFEPTSGEIWIDGKDYKKRSQLWLHSNIGYVLQSPHLFTGSIMDNIRYGKLDATDEEVIAAAKAVSADTVVAHLEKGWDTNVGEGGDRLSTGEKQLISFARAILANPRIFVLDEATSSIDTQTEQLIQSAIDHLLENRTSFLIAHRLSTIRKADLILVVKDGQIVEKGTHRELLLKKGYYHDLYSKQFAEEAQARLLG